MRKILVICTTVFGYNGIASVIFNYYKATNKDIMKIDMITINEPPANIKDMFEINGGHIYVVPRKSNPIKYMSNIKKIMKENKYDLLHVHGNSATMAIELLAAKQAGIPVRIPHSHNTICDHKFIHNLLKPIFNSTYSYGFACGTEAGKWLFGDNDFVVMNNGVDTKRYEFQENYRYEIRKKHNIEDKFVVGHIGLFNYQKNHEKLIEIFSLLHKKNGNSVLVLVGEGPEEENIKKLVKEKGLTESVIFAGTTNDVNKYLMAFDVFALPSRFEGLPLVLVEAQCTGLHCVASSNVSIEADITGLVEFVDYEKDIDTYVNKLYATGLKVKDRELVATESIKTIKLKGFSIWDNGKRMEELYKVYIDNSKKN